MSGTLDRDKLADMLLLAALTHHYTHFERRLEGAVNPGDAKVSEQIAIASVNLFVRTCGPELVPQVEKRRAELVELLVAQRLLINEGLFEMTQHLERPMFVGPINTIFNQLRRINIVMAGDSSKPAGRYAQTAKEQFLPESLFLDSWQITWPDLDNRNCLLYGTPTSPLVGELLAECNWQVTPTHIALGHLLVQGENLALIACRARPSDPTLGDVVYTCAEERVLVGINGLHHGPSDFVIGRINAEATRYEVILRGNFGRGEDGKLTTTPVATDQAPAVVLPQTSTETS